MLAVDAMVIYIGGKLLPELPGTYQIRCAETDYKWSTLRVYKAYDHVLRVDCPDVGKGYSVRDYHNGLTNPEWRLVGW